MYVKGEPAEAAAEIFPFGFLPPFPNLVAFPEMGVFCLSSTCHSDCKGIFYGITVKMPLKEQIIFLKVWNILRKNCILFGAPGE